MALWKQLPCPSVETSDRDNQQFSDPSFTEFTSDDQPLTKTCGNIKSLMTRERVSKGEKLPSHYVARSTLFQMTHFSLEILRLSVWGICLTPQSTGATPEEQKPLAREADFLGSRGTEATWSWTPVSREARKLVPEMEWAGDQVPETA